MKCKNCKQKEATLVFKDVQTCRECLYDYWDENLKESAFEDFIDMETKGFAK